MSDYIVSARKYRPQTFESVVGQGAIAATLKNAIRAGKLAHAYLFCGPRGVGKTTCARIFAKTINCMHLHDDGEACNECESCLAFNEGRSLNIHELDAASNNSVDDIRNLIEQVRIPPQIGKYKVFIIDEVHMLSPSAFNAFLKTLEEPPAHAIFILATTEKHKILPTILSRCQIYDFQRMSVENTIKHLQYVAEREGYTYEPAALNVIAQKADGGMRDALSIFDQVVSFCGGNITYKQVIQNLNVLDYDYYFRLVDLMLEHKVTESMLLFNEVLSKGFEGGPFVNGLASHLRDVLVARDPQSAVLLEVSEDIRQRYVDQAARCKPSWLYAAIRLCNNCDQNYRNSRNKRLQVEIMLIECAQLDDDGVGAGRRPTRQLLPIFSLLSTDGQATVEGSPVGQKQTGAAAPSQQHTLNSAATAAQPYGSATASSPVSTTAQTSSAASPAKSASGSPVSTESPQRITIKLGKIGGPTLRHQSAKSDVSAVKPETAPSISKDNGPAEPATTSVQPTAPAQPNKPLELNEVLVSWQRFINSMPREETAFAQRMRIMQPVITGDNVLEVTVENNEVEKRLSAIVPRITDFMRQDLSNSSLSITLNVTDHPIEPQRYDKRKQLLHFCDLNPALIELGKAFKLELQ
ncbi:MAG: DNA polymerase III subunit gamma/tau [Bacteroidaceae bacterium]|nr:DNA polymerase III subunit gamma/tau [Bacteroidaceae bacterium]